MTNSPTEQILKPGTFAYFPRKSTKAYMVREHPESSASVVLYDGDEFIATPFKDGRLQKSDATPSVFPANGETAYKLEQLFNVGFEEVGTTEDILDTFKTKFDVASPRLAFVTDEIEEMERFLNLGIQRYMDGKLVPVVLSYGEDYPFLDDLSGDVFKYAMPATLSGKPDFT